MGVALAVSDAFNRHIICASASRGTEDDSRLEIRFYVPLQYQLDHSLAVKRGIEDAKATFRKHRSGYRCQVFKKRESIILTFYRIANDTH